MMVDYEVNWGLKNPSANQILAYAKDPDSTARRGRSWETAPS